MMNTSMAEENRSSKNSGKGVRQRGTSVISSPLDAAETGQASNEDEPPRHTNATRKLLGRRKVFKKKKSSSKSAWRALQRRWTLIQKRDPRLAWTHAVGTFLFALIICFGAAIFAYSKLDNSSTDIFHSEAKLPADIIFGVDAVSMTHVLFPMSDKFDPGLMAIPDYGGLNILFFEEEGAQRNFFQASENNETDFREPGAKQDDDVTDVYYAYDDDYVRGTGVAYNETNKIDKNKRCRRISEHRLNFQTCNIIHELELLDTKSEFTYLAEGAYRQVFSLDNHYEKKSEMLALKDLCYDNDVRYDNFEFVRMDAIVAERLSSSPRTFDLFGFCGLSILSEYFYHDDIESVVAPGSGYMKAKNLHDEDELKPQNNLTAPQKLALALEMAEGLADLHGYSGGVIIHDDVQLSQYLFNEDKSVLKLNDFNRAEFTFWDETNQEYCRYTNGHGGGNWRAPEEYEDWPLNEKIDVWSVANNMYALLTGLNPLYELRHDKKFKKAIKEGETAFIDPRYRSRSKEEAKLAEIIERCFQFKPDDRPSIFEVVDFLKQAMVETLGAGASRAKILQQIDSADDSDDDSDDSEE